MENWKISAGNVDEFLDNLKGGKGESFLGLVLNNKDKARVIKISEDGQALTHERVTKLLRDTIGFLELPRATLARD